MLHPKTHGRLLVGPLRFDGPKPVAPQSPVMRRIPMREEAAGRTNHSSAPE